MGTLASHNLGPALVAVAWVFGFIAIVIVAARFYVRRNITKRLSLDDWIILFTLALALCDSVFVSISVSWGLGQHVQDLDAIHQMNSLKWVYLCEIFAIMCPCFGRISYAYLLLGIVTPTTTRRRFLWTIIAIQFVVDLGTVIISMSQCQPIQKFWDHSIEGNCWDVHVQEYTGFFQGSVCSLVDLMLAVFPASLFWNMNMGRKQKLVLSTMMGLGIFAMIASIVKTVQLEAIGQTNDLTYGMADLAIWWTLEAYFVLICVSIPTLRPIFVRKANAWDHSTEHPTVNSFGVWQQVANKHNRMSDPEMPVPALYARYTEVRSNTSSNADSRENDGFEMKTTVKTGRGQPAAM